jgi:hypothetical protein
MAGGIGVGVGLGVGVETVATELGPGTALAVGNTLKGSKTNAVSMNNTKPPVAEMNKPFRVPFSKTPPTKNMAKKAAERAIR